MSWVITVLNLVVNVGLTLFAASFAFAIYRLLSRGSYTPTGDPELGAELSRQTSKWSSRRVAVAWVDLHARPGTTRMAFLGADEQRPFEIGSLTKALTGLLVADAVTRGELRLDEPLRQFDPRLTGELGEQTLQSLVTHTSGLPRIPRSMAPRGLLASTLSLNPYPRKGPDIIALAARQKLKNAGSHAYSNLGAALAGQLVARRLGGDYHALLRTRVLEPMGMTSAHTDPAHHTVKRGWTSIGRHSMPWVQDQWAPAGGCVASLADMAALAENLLRKNPVTRLATQPVAGAPEPGPNMQQAIFFRVSTVPDTGRRMVSHSGQTGGYSAFLGVFPDARRAIVVLSDTAAAAITERTALRIVRTMVEQGNGARGAHSGR